MQPHALSDSKNCPSYIDPLVPENVIVNNFAARMRPGRAFMSMTLLLGRNRRAAQLLTAIVISMIQLALHS